DSATFNSLYRSDAAQMLDQQRQPASSQSPQGISQQHGHNCNRVSQRSFKSTVDDRRKNSAKNNGEHRVGETGEQQRYNGLASLTETNDRYPDDRNDQGDSDWCCGTKISIKLMSYDSYEWSNERECSQSNDERPWQGSNSIHANYARKIVER